MRTPASSKLASFGVAMRPSSSSKLAWLVLGAALLVPTGADARKAAKAPKVPPPNADQQDVVAAIVNDTFPRPRREPLRFALCLDVQIAPAFDEDAAPPPPPPRRGRRPPAPELPPPPILRGAPPELVAGLARPWRVVASALACRLDPRQPYTLNDAAHTPAQLVTVHLAPEVSSGTVRVEWTDSRDPTATSSRDCTAAHTPRGWSVHCGGTWFQ